MSKYNNFAKELDSAFKVARNDYKKAHEKLQQAQQENQRANLWRAGDSPEEKRVRVARAALNLKDAEKVFKNAETNILASFNQTRKEICARLENEVRANSLADPTAIDNGALELMKAGVLTADDFASFAERYDSNPTMLKLVAHYAEQAAKDTTDNHAAAAFNMVALNCKDGQGAVMRKWEELQTLCDYCTGQKTTSSRFETEHAIRMCDQWETVSSEAIENF